ncbi:hypothetical protein B0H16DRAFT_1884193 [Mycena metata]|uniref:Uncharacterized protein n=1 Tax=Mycena metata TaxID=1033252 RepID=A0AAD7JF99_9AGAR|nr:hypothetical protein B0H16DRAFT_1884193 [Mycena metata]
MHLFALNLSDLFLSLWHGTMQCDPDDDKSTWDWMVLVGDVWKKHGEDIAKAAKHLPSYFDKPPRNPAEKMNSGYKAQEFLNYLYVLGPALLRDILPKKYWQHLGKLVAGVRIVWKRKIPRDQLQRAHKPLCEVDLDFERPYYQHKASRLQFCRQSVHALVHTCPETVRVGPGGYRSQWTMERTIGNLGEEIKQHSNPYANLSQRGMRRCRTNALVAMIPSLLPDKGLPAGAEDLGNGFILPRARDEFHQRVDGEYGLAILTFLEEEEGEAAKEGWPAPNVKYVYDKEVWYGEVQFFFQATINKTGKEHSLALVSVHSDPDAEILEESYGTVIQCDYFGEEALEVIAVGDIQAGVAMIPIGEDGAPSAPSPALRPDELLSFGFPIDYGSGPSSATLMDPTSFFASAPPFPPDLFPFAGLVPSWDSAPASSWLPDLAQPSGIRDESSIPTPWDDIRDDEVTSVTAWLQNLNVPAPDQVQKFTLLSTAISPWCLWSDTTGAWGGEKVKVGLESK